METQTQTQTSPLACSCGGTAKFERVMGLDRKSRNVVRRARLVCPACGAATGWEPASHNGEHRQELVSLWANGQKGN